MKSMPWLDLGRYGITLFLIRDLNGKGKHSLVITGPRVSEYADQLKILGFARDKRFPTKNYWGCSSAGLNPAHIKKVFVEAELVDTPLDKIMPQRMLSTTPRTTVTPAKKDKTNGTEFRSPQHLSGDAVRSPADAGTGGSPVLGADGPRGSVPSQSGANSGNVQSGDSSDVPAQSTSEALGRGAGAGESLEESQSDQRQRVPSRPRSVAEPREAVSSRTTDRRAVEEPFSAQLGIGRNGPVAVEFLLERSRAWTRVVSGFESDAEAVASLPGLLRSFAASYNVNLRADNVSSRVVNDLTGNVTFKVNDVSELDDEVARFVARAERASQKPIPKPVATHTEPAGAPASVVATEPEPSVQAPTDQAQLFEESADTDPEVEVAALDAAAEGEQDDYRLETIRFFSMGLRRLAYEHFQNDPSAVDGIDFEQFIQFMEAGAGEQPQQLIIQQDDLVSLVAHETLVYSPDPVIQLEFERAVFASRAIAEVLTARGPGSAALVHDGVHWLAPGVHTRDTLVAEEAPTVNETDWSSSMLSSGISEGWSEHELKETSAGYFEWLKTPIFFDADRSLLAEAGLAIAARYSGVLPEPAEGPEIDFVQDVVAPGIVSEGNGQAAELPVGADVTTDSDEPAVGPLIVQSEEPAAVEIDRIWRGLTKVNLDATEYEFKNSTPARIALNAFRNLVSAEKFGVGSLQSTEKPKLLAFRGWGGVANDLRTDSRIKSRNVIGDAIAKVLEMSTGEFNRTMMANRLESYYTPPALCSSMWGILSRAGVSPHGRYFEPGCGAAHMFVGAPEEVQRHGRLVGVERDPLAARIAAAVAPDALIINKPFEEVVLDRGFDAVIGNVPFGETVITDARYPKAQNIHDYFIVRSLDHMKPGGVMAVITSSGTMDKKDESVRKQIMERANLVAGFRLPIEAFEKQGASVTTDILVFQRRPKGAAPDFDFTTTTSVSLPAGGEQQEFNLNEYYVNNPQQVLGKHVAVSSAFGFKLAVRNGDEGTNAQMTDRIAFALNELVREAIPAGIVERAEWPREAAVNPRLSSESSSQLNAVMLEAYEGLVGDYTIVDGKVLEILDIVNQFDADGVLVGTMHEAIGIATSKTQLKILTAYVPLRDSARALVRAQMGGSDEELEGVQEHTLGLYNKFVESFGPLNSKKILRVIGDDTGSAEVCALEIWDDDKDVVVRLSDTFSKRVIRAEVELKPDNSDDAFFMSIDQRGHIDLEWMSQVSGIEKETLIEELLGHRIFIDPETDEYATADLYLSGNVVRKLEQAMQAVETDERFLVNVQSLQAVQPEAIPYDQITMRIGANWIPPHEISEFVGDLLGRKFTGEADFKVRYSEGAGIWTVEVSTAFKRDFEAQRLAVFGTKDATFEMLLEMLLNTKRPSHYDKLDDGRSVLNDEATMASRAKQDELNEKFYAWVGNDPERVERFSLLYNRATNVMRLPTPDGSRLTFPGLSPSWKPYKHQRDKIAMSMMGYNDMAAHPVGAGKTFEMVATAMKLKQLGMHKKPLIAVPNHMLGQISREAKQMYPGARILMITGEDLVGDRRRRFFAIARNNDWDIVVCTHSMLNQMSAPLDIVLAEFDTELAVIEAKISETDSQRAERQLQALLKSVTTKRLAAETQHDADSKRKGALTIDQLGIDSISVDEAHLYKNLGLNSGMNVLGVTTGGSQRAFNLYAICQYLRQLHGKSAGVHFYTGTPISNSMCELFVHNKMLRPDLLHEVGIHHFDEWANRFGEVVSSLEALPEGGGFRVNERFSRFVNLPEMIKLFRSFADVKSKEQLNLPTPQLITNIVAVEQSEWQQAFMKHLSRRAIAVRSGRVRPNEDNMLSVSSAGRKSALDMRLVDPDLPADSSAKLAEVATNVHKEWLETGEVRGAQLVFMDQGTPGKDKPFTCYDTLKALLIEKGIPSEEIAFIHEAKTNDAKEALFSKVRSGEIRVFMGSTEKMGVGTNVQERLSATHDVDCPWRPSDIAQRLGRIERVGNLFFDVVKNFRYTTKDSFDLFMWETNKRKAAFIAEGLADPTLVSREVSEEMDMGFAEIMSVTTGNPRIRDKVQIDDKVNKLERKQRAWYGDRANKMTARFHLNNQVKQLDSRLVWEQDIAKALPVSRYRNVTVSGAITDLQDGDTTWLYATEAGLAAQSRTAVIEGRMMRNNEREMPLNMRIGQIELIATISPQGLVIRGTLHGESLAQNIVSMSKNPQIVGRGLRGWFDFTQRITKLKSEIETTRKGLASLNGFNVEDEWEHQGELEALKAEKIELDTWFASQNFDKVDDGPDPFLHMLAAYKADLRDDAAAELEGDHLEAAHEVSDLFADDSFLSSNDMKKHDKLAAPGMR